MSLCVQSTVLATGETVFSPVDFDGTAQSCMDMAGQLLMTFEDFLGVNYEMIGITPESIGESFVWGFGLVITFWSLGYALSVAKAVINKA